MIINLKVKYIPWYTNGLIFLKKNNILYSASFIMTYLKLFLFMGVLN